MEQAEGTLTVEVEDAQIVGFVQIAKLDLEVVAIALLGEVQRDLVGDELSMPLAPSFSGSVGSVKEACEVRTTRGPLPANNKGGFHYAHPCPDIQSRVSRRDGG